MAFIDPVMLRAFYEKRKSPGETFEQFRIRVYSARAQEAAREFELEGDPLSALMSVQIALEGGVPLPAAVASWLAEGVGKYMNAVELNDSGRSLDAALGMSAPGRGRRRAEDECRIRRNQDSIVLEVSGLVGKFGISLEAAAEMVAARLKDPAEHKSGEAVHSPGTIIKYARRHPRYNRWVGLSKDFFEWQHCQNCPTANCPFLVCYPSESWPAELKSRFGVLEGECTKR